MDEYGINAFTSEKRKIRSLIRMFDLFMTKRKKKSTHDTVSQSGHPITQVLYEIIHSNTKEISDHTRMSGRSTDRRYQEMINNVLEFFLMIYSSDTAFGDIGDAMLLAMYQPENAERILSYLEKYQPDIKNCYYNIWEDFKAETRKLEDKGLLQRGQLGDNEMLLVDNAIARKTNNWRKSNMS